MEEVRPYVALAKYSTATQHVPLPRRVVSPFRWYISISSTASAMLTPFRFQGSQRSPRRRSFSRRQRFTCHRVHSCSWAFSHRAPVSSAHSCGRLSNAASVLRPCACSCCSSSRPASFHCMASSDCSRRPAHGGACVSQRKCSYSLCILVRCTAHSRATRELYMRGSSRPGRRHDGTGSSPSPTR